jgi:hypothetical protein
VGTGKLANKGLGMKGLIYTIITILIVATVIGLLLAYTNLLYSLRKDVSEKITSDQLHFFEKNIEEDVERALYTAGKRALVAAVNYVVINNHSLDDSIERIRELMENGTIYGEASKYMEDNTITNWTVIIEKVANQAGYIMELNTSHVDIRPLDSFNLIFKINLTINLTEPTRKIKIDRFVEKYVVISIEKMEDPLPSLKTGGNYKKVIVKCPFEEHVRWVEEINDYDFTNLKEDIKNGYYHPSKTGASFLDRLEGRLTTSSKYQNLAPSPDTIIGLEFFVNRLKLPQDSEYNQKAQQSVIDHLYWDDAFHKGYEINHPSIQNDPEVNWFKIDKEEDSSLSCSNCPHYEIYQIPESLLE